MKNKITLRTHLSMLLIQAICLTGGVLIGFMLFSAVIFSEDEFWTNVETFFGVR